MTNRSEMAKIKSYIRSILRDRSKKHSEEDVFQLNSLLKIKDLDDLRINFRFYTEWMNFEKRGHIKHDGVLFSQLDEPTKIKMVKINKDLVEAYRDCGAVKCLWHTPKGTYTEPGKAALRFKQYNYKDIIRICNSDDPAYADWFVIDLVIEQFYDETTHLPYNDIEDPLNGEPQND